MIMKVHCINCKHFDGDSECFHPDNIIVYETWKDRLERPNLKPKDINKNMDCEWYTKKHGGNLNGKS